MISPGDTVMVYTYAGMVVGTVMTSPQEMVMEERGIELRHPWPSDVVVIDVHRDDGKRIVRHVDDVVALSMMTTEESV